MPNYIVKLEEKYFLYSSVADLPVSAPLPLEEFKEYYWERTPEQNGRLEERLTRVEAKGTSEIDSQSAKETLVGEGTNHESRFEAYQKWARGELTASQLKLTLWGPAVAEAL
jgi:hypothetical protein